MSHFSTINEYHPPPPPTWNNTNPNPNPNYSPYAPHTQHYQNPNAQVSGNQPNNQGFNLNNQGFQPNNQGFQANNQGFQPNNQGFQQNNQGFQPNNQGFEPNGKLHCPFCGKWTESFPKKIAGGVTYAWCICLFFFTGIFCCVPFCVGGCKDTQMVCVVCQQAKARIPAKCC